MPQNPDDQPTSAVSEHKRLFGPDAKLSSIGSLGHLLAILLGTDAEQAMALRPRSDSFGRDIPIGPGNTQPGPYEYDSPDLRAAHQQLFGMGARMDPNMADQDWARASLTPDEQAMLYRPRAATAGRDVSLPNETRSALIQRLKGR